MYLIITKDTYNLFNEEAVKTYLNELKNYSNIRIFALNGLHSAPKELFIQQGYVTDFFDNFMFDF